MPDAPLVAVTIEDRLDDTVHGASLVEHPAGAEAVDSPSSQLPDCPKGARLVPLSGKHGAGLFAIVDEADCGLVAGISWYLQAKKRGRGYAMGKRGGVPIYMHRLITGAGPGEDVDHADRDTLNNRRANLRRCTRSENSANRVAGNRWGFKGISKARNQFQAALWYRGKRVYLGLFLTIEEAARAYDTAAKQFFGPFARLNFPDESAVSHATDNARGESLCRQTIGTISGPKEVSP